MKNNAIILTTLGGLLECLDTKKIVYIYLKRDKTEVCLKAQKLVYEILVDKTFIKKYEKYKVVGLNQALGSISLMIEED